MSTAALRQDNASKQWYTIRCVSAEGLLSPPCTWLCAPVVTEAATINATKHMGCPTGNSIALRTYASAQNILPMS